MKTGLKKEFIPSSKEEAKLMMQEVDALMKDLRKEVIEELSGQSLERVLAELESLKEELSSPPHYPARLSQELAGRLNLSLQQGAQLVEALEHLDFTRYRCVFESLDERERRSRLEVLNPDTEENFR